MWQDHSCGYFGLHVAIRFQLWSFHISFTYILYERLQDIEIVAQTFHWCSGLDFRPLDKLHTSLLSLSIFNITVNIQHLCFLQSFWLSWFPIKLIFHQMLHERSGFWEPIASYFKWGQLGAANLCEISWSKMGLTFLYNSHSVPMSPSMQKLYFFVPFNLYCHRL